MMNERIKELALQAGFENGHQDRNGNSLSCELEKLAELIVQVCAVTARLHVINISTYSDAEFVEEEIKQHFGVK
jgi:hypothetical protein